MENKTDENTQRIAVLEKRLDQNVWRSWAILILTTLGLVLNIVRFNRDFHPAASPPVNISPQISPTQTNGSGESAKISPARDWITVREFAEANGMAERTVLAYIAQGRIDPFPVKTERAWQLSADSRILPQPAANGGF